MSIEYLRSFRVAGYAVFDLFFAFAGINLVSPWLSRQFLKLGINIPKLSWIFFTIPIGIFVHKLFGVNTLLNENFFEVNNHLVLKLVVISLTFLGIRGIRLKKQKKAK